MASLRPAGLGRRPWPSGGDDENAVISIGSRILTLLNEVWLWLDFEGAFGVVVTMAPDLGVFGEYCDAMGVDSGEERMNKNW